MTDDRLPFAIQSYCTFCFLKIGFNERTDFIWAPLICYALCYLYLAAVYIFEYVCRCATHITRWWTSGRELVLQTRYSLCAKLTARLERKDANHTLCQTGKSLCRHGVDFSVVFARTLADGNECLLSLLFVHLPPTIFKCVCLYVHCSLTLPFTLWANC